MTETKTVSLTGSGADAQPATQGWQQIETVPFNRRVLLGCWYADDCNGYYGESRWTWIISADNDGNGWWWCDFNDNEFKAEGHQKPTHWREMLDEPA